MRFAVKPYAVLVIGWLVLLSLTAYPTLTHALSSPSMAPTATATHTTMTTSAPYTRRLYLPIVPLGNATDNEGPPPTATPQPPSPTATRQSPSPTATRQPPSPTATQQPSPTPNWQPSFGVEYFSGGSLARETMLDHIGDLKPVWMRFNGRISWRALQPDEGEPIQWEQLASFEEELRALKQLGVKPLVIISDYPRWATINEPFPTSCGAIRQDKLGAFADFVRALVTRYKRPEFDVHYWQLGNEPDVDPTLVPPDYHLGCWGDSQDIYYGGRRYGEMVKVIGPTIKAADPAATVWLGGLLLYTYDTHWVSDPGKPEMFMKGILESGAAPYFDVVTYHAYAPYGTEEPIDHELVGVWEEWGGFVVGKARFLRQVMSEYGVDKPLVVTEISLMCPESYPFCEQPSEQFDQAQADHAVRTTVRGTAEGVRGYTWYTINDNGWRETDLLRDNERKLVYTAYQQLIQQLSDTVYAGPVEYQEGVEAYAFASAPNEQVHVLWAQEDETIPILVPKSRFVRAFDRDGNAITPSSSGTDYQLLAQFEPLYLVVRSP
ncbi:MAG: hypothetical protein M3220_09595 [Chloroflexota bacterium]|nr:hypothetical protein [Chloroflexota bacterium]